MVFLKNKDSIDIYGLKLVCTCNADDGFVCVWYTAIATPVIPSYLPNFNVQNPTPNGFSVFNNVYIRTKTALTIS